MRAFIAVTLPEDVRAAIAADAAALRDAIPGVGWTKAESLHVTLKFLGSVDDPVPLWRAVVERLAGRPAGSVAARGLGAFPSPRRASVLWAGIDDPAGALAALAEETEAVAERFGFEREKRSYTPHVTIGRARRGPVDASAPIAAAAGRRFGVVPVDGVVLFESRPGPAGSQYIERGRVPLGQGASHGDSGEDRHP